MIARQRGLRYFIRKNYINNFLIYFVLDCMLLAKLQNCNLNSFLGKELHMWSKLSDVSVLTKKILRQICFQFVLYCSCIQPKYIKSCFINFKANYNSDLNVLNWLKKLNKLCQGNKVLNLKVELKTFALVLYLLPSFNINIQTNRTDHFIFLFKNNEQNIHQNIF
jgi:hypothetical protein